MIEFAQRITWSMHHVMQWPVTPSSRYSKYFALTPYSILLLLLQIQVCDWPWTNADLSHAISVLSTTLRKAGCTTFVFKIRFRQTTYPRIPKCGDQL